MWHLPSFREEWPTVRVMSDDIRCPACGEDEDLKGVREDDVIHITCHSCDATWDRSLEKRCPRCDAGDMYPVPVAIVEKSRGSQLSILTTQPRYFCWICDRDIIDAQRQSGIALMPDELPTITKDDRPI